MSLRTHYDNLKVSRDAPIEVIRAAYKSLAQKYHPDRNPGDEHAAKVMLLINEAYEVLSDPARRKQHDSWIRAKEQAARAAASPPPQPEVRPQREPQPSPPPSQSQHQQASPSAGADAAPSAKKKGSRLSKLFWAGALIYALTQAFPGIKSFHQSAAPVSTGTSATYYVPSSTSGVGATTKPIPKSQCVAMPRSPKGKPWPTMAQTITKFHSKGHSSITLDNTGGNSNIYAKVTIAGTKTDVKDGYVPAGQSLELKDLSPGNYVIKYKNIVTGCSSISKEFELNEAPTQTGVNYTHVDLTIYAVPDGNMKVKSLPDSDF